MRLASHTSARSTGKAVVAALALVMTMPGIANAQQWIENRSYTEGIGIKLGSSMVFHPGLGVEAGYDSNVYFTDSDPVGAARLRIVPSIAFATLPPQRLEMTEGGLSGKKPTVEFRFGLAGIYEDWFGKDKSLDNRRDFGILADIGLVIFPYGKWQFRLSDEFNRTIRPPNAGLKKNYTLDHNVAALGLHFVPGQAFDVGLDARYNMNFYELELLRDAGNYHKIDVELNLKWKFLPKTAVIFSTVVSPYIRKGTTYGDDPIIPINGSINLESWIGLQGLFTPRFGIAAQLGYGAAFFDKPSAAFPSADFDSILARAELRFFVTPMSAVRLGFIRDMRPSYFTNYYIRNEGYLSYEQLIVGKVLLSAKFRVGYWQYSPLYECDTAACGSGSLSTAFGAGNNPRTDIVLGGILFGEYRITDWIAINATFQYTGDFTKAQLASTLTGAIPESYNKFEILGGVRAMY